MKSALTNKNSTYGLIAWKSEEFPLHSMETQMKLLKQVGSIVDVCIEDKDISISHRIKSDSAIPPIIVSQIH